MKTVSMREHGTASISEQPNATCLTVGEAMSLDRAQRGVGVEAFRWLGRNQISAASQVGMIATPSARLEILPKIAELGIGETRGTLMRMIATAWDVPIRDGEITGHECQDRDLLELLIGLFARRLQEQVRAGLSRAYRRREDDLSLLRGKLDMTRQFTKLAAAPQKLACRYDEFTADTRLNRLLLCATTFLQRRTARADTQRLLNEIAMHFEDVSIKPASSVLVKVPKLDRTDRRWSIPAKLAELLLSKVYQTAHGGTQEGIAITFDMNRLFEAYVARVARNVCSPLGYQLIAQGPRNHLAMDPTGRGAFRTKPDLYVKRGENTIVIDTKWKHLNPGLPNLGAAQTDAYQMHAYAHIYRINSVILLYPHHKGFSGPAGVQARWHLKTADSALILATIDLANPYHFGASIRFLLLEDKSS